MHMCVTARDAVQKKKPTRGSRHTHTGIGLSTPKIRGGKVTYTHTIHQSTVRRNRILPSRPTHRYQAEDFRVPRDTSPTQGIHRHARSGRATNAAGNAKEERSNKPGAQSNRLAADTASLPQAPDRVEQEGHRAHRGNGSIRHVRREGRLNDTPRGTVSGRGT